MYMENKPRETKNKKAIIKMKKIDEINENKTQ